MAIVTKKDVLDWGLTGVMARGSGYNWEGVPYGFSTFMEEGPNKGIETTFYRFTDNGGYEKVTSCMHQAACLLRF